MRLERLNADKIKIFLTFDDLRERGISKEDLWTNLPKVEELFREMIMEADDELGFEADGPIEIEVFSLPAQGMVVIVSKRFDSDLGDADDDDYIEMQVTLDETDDILYQFRDFEDVLALARKLHDLGVRGGSLYLFENRYYLIFEDEAPVEDLETFVAILAEYGSPSTMTNHRLEEYGKLIMKDQAVAQLYQYFFAKKPH
ncbi:genetic competence negative regulator [Caenibacillus caldisaponilyticus]|jgi:adapter protein MecA 1/2|uniref:genetic competence negative regulator n=1 Tax=Caenibacillus caldisaponilyticus TaxID=1674942 RepID=UPI00098845BB|nr:genetic competence negative regulator [Caenibacillus caldisaponilyticus]